MHAAIYVRVSTGLQAVEGTSLETQLDYCLRKAFELGISQNDIHIYREEGASGEDLDRPALNRLRQDVASGTFSVLILTHPDRLTRDLTDKLFICRELESRNIRLVFVDTEYKNTPEGQLFFNLMSVIAQYELSLIKKRTVRGRLKAVEKENKIMPMRTAPYGYDIIGSKLVINEEEARFVRYIYEWYVHQRWTIRQIGEKLVELGAIPKRKESRSWSASSIQRILTSEIYIGRYYYNRRKTGKVKGQKTPSGSNRKLLEWRKEEDWIRVEVPAIIDTGIYEQAMQQRQRNRKKSGHVKESYLLRGLIRCGECGRSWQATSYSGRADPMSGAKKKYLCYRCPNKTPATFGTTRLICTAPSLKAEWLDQNVWKSVLVLLTDFTYIHNRLCEQEEGIRRELAGKKAALQEQFKQTDQELDRIKWMFQKNVLTEEELLRGTAELNKRNKELAKEIEIAVKQEKQVLQRLENRNEINRTASEIAAWICQKEWPVGEKRKIVELLVEEIVITVKGKRVYVSVKGPLGELLRKKQTKVKQEVN
ncbi:recombinase family protein [Paenibacillus larvae]|uniref:Recombinase family protein n=2 Tax=Paenibacillus larvae TaxID=1464 RepID=A0AAP5JVR9_9BACL|nr:recombinase family protein [Paenibacillus larvae]AQR77501.1 recombinase family protein [Paenibacillus larvae subsp. larvae]AVF21460.1 putative DNA recombinase CisA [Paenibacillus larvae subsp. larvae]ETK30250.1 putative DNA recombinase CisA [Paenibacillus larvae subsp. larvae DSM 25719]MCY7477624.1 recombinase family protein [Paenibacillus larvae]MCY7489596.1 recombinase family protein [Paenibacillus larvae]